MSAPKMVAGREAAKRERSAFLVGATWRFDLALDHGATMPPISQEMKECAARDRYPLPKVERPLRGKFSDGTVAWFNGSVIVREGNCTATARALAGYLATNADFILLGRMLSGELELVDDEGGES